MTPKNKFSLRRMRLRQHLAWGGDTSGKEGLGRLAGQCPQGCLGPTVAIEAVLGGGGRGDWPDLCRQGCLVVPA